MLAALLAYPQGAFVSSLDLNRTEIVVTREIDGGTETLALKLPAVITVDQRLNQPRFVKLPNLMLARKKAIEIINRVDIEVDILPHQKLLKVTEPKKRKTGIKVSSVTELIEKLHTHAGIRI